MMRRVLFFAVAAFVCFLMVPVLDAKYAWVPKWVGAVYVLLTVLTALDGLGRRRL